MFVTFNMASYAVFTGTCLLAFTKRIGFLLMPAMFFVVYGAIGNAIAHTWWSIDLGTYFPGLITAQAYWVAGPFVLHRLLGDRRRTAVVVLGTTVLLVPLLSVFADAARL